MGYKGNQFKILGNETVAQLVEVTSKFDPDLSCYLWSLHVLSDHMGFLLVSQFPPTSQRLVCLWVN